MQLPLKENEFGVTIVLIPHNNNDRFKTRLDRDLMPTILAHPNCQFQLIVIDNSDENKRVSYNFPKSDNLQHEIIWPGSNIMYGPSMNLAIERSAHPYLVYVCSNHGHMYDTGWIDDLVNPVIKDPEVAMAGSLYPSCAPADMGFPSHLPRIHIQGGIFAARTGTLLAYPYTTDERWVHWGSDIFQSYQLLSAGYQLFNVDSINSVWRQCVHAPENWKFVHDYSEY